MRISEVHGVKLENVEVLSVVSSIFVVLAHLMSPSVDELVVLFSS